MKKTLGSIAVLIAFAFIASATGSNSESDNGSPQAMVKSKQAVRVELGQPLKTDYFEVVVNKVSLKNSVRTGNEFADKEPEEGNMFLILNTSFKNIDNESRMLTDGVVWVEYNGKEYQFDNSETVMLEGWGLMMDQINPLTTKKTNLVYKIPAELKGPAYYQPGRADKDQRIFLGELK